MMQAADGDAESVADLPAHRDLLRKLEVVGIRRGSTANEAGLRGHKLQVFAVALAHGLGDDRDRRLGRIDL